MPTRVVNNVSEFRSAPASAWHDPPVVYGYEFQGVNGSLFTAIEDFAPGFDRPFRVKVGMVDLGLYTNGQSVVFAEHAAALGALLLPGGGVERFTVTEILPLCDNEDAMAFPIKLGFTTPLADFDMIALSIDQPCGWDLNCDGSITDADRCAWIANPVDLNGDGATTSADLAMFSSQPNICPANFNCVGGITIDDLFLYFYAYFSGDLRGDFNGIGGTSIDDLFLYINAYFVGC